MVSILSFKVSMIRDRVHHHRNAGEQASVVVFYHKGWLDATVETSHRLGIRWIVSLGEDIGGDAINN